MPAASRAQIDAVRRFARFFTARTGVLRKRLYSSRFSLIEARIVYELAHRDSAVARDLAAALQVDPGYLSRVLAGLGRLGLVRAGKVPGDARRRALALTARGAAAFAKIDAASRDEVGAMLEPLDPAGRDRLVAVLAAAEKLLDPAPAAPAVPFVLRDPRPGDLGWIVHRHGAIYAAEFGWDDSFEGYVADIVARYRKNFDPKRERCWIAERDGEIVGSIVAAHDSPEQARLRLFYLEKSARGLGLARRMVEECLAFARNSGHKRIVLSTYRSLDAARKLYAGFGFELTRAEAVRHYGLDLIEEDWALEFD